MFCSQGAIRLCFAPLLFFLCFIIRNNINIQFRRIHGKLIRKAGFPYETSVRNASSGHNFGNSAVSGIFRDQKRNIGTTDGFNLRSQLLCQMDIFFQPRFIFFSPFFKIGSLNIKANQSSSKSLSHPGRCPDNFGIRR